MTDLLDEIRQRAESKNYASVGGAVTMTQVEADRRTLLRLLDATREELVTVLGQIDRLTDRVIAVTAQRDRFAEYVPIEELTLGMRAYNVLTAARIRFVGELLRMTEDDVTDLRNAGTKTLENVNDRLREEFGLALRQQEAP